MGVCVEPREYVLGLRTFEHYVWRTQPEGQPSGPGDLDLTIYGLRRYCRLAIKESSTVLLLLFVNGEHVLERQPLGAELQALASAFWSMRVARSFLGYLDAQRRGLLGERHATRTRELAGVHGYDTKYAMHALRIAHQETKLLSSGRKTLPVPGPVRERLMQVRRGEPTLAEVLEGLREQTALLETAALKGELPEQPDHSAIDSFLAEVYQRRWTEKGNFE